MKDAISLHLRSLEDDLLEFLSPVSPVTKHAVSLVAELRVAGDEILNHNNPCLRPSIREKHGLTPVNMFIPSLAGPRLPYSTCIYLFSFITLQELHSVPRVQFCFAPRVWSNSPPPQLSSASGYMTHNNAIFCPMFWVYILSRAARQSPGALQGFFTNQFSNSTCVIILFFSFSQWFRENSFDGETVFYKPWQLNQEDVWKMWPGTFQWR